MPHPILNRNIEKNNAYIKNDMSPLEISAALSSYHQDTNITEYNNYLLFLCCVHTSAQALLSCIRLFLAKSDLQAAGSWLLGRINEPIRKHFFVIGS
jgi:hypothetical protein